jgi:hypothetical protein
LIPRDAVVEALTIAVGELANEISSFPNYADELNAAAKAGGVDAVRALCRRISNQVRDSMSHRLQLAAVMAAKEADGEDDVITAHPDGELAKTKSDHAVDDFDDTIQIRPTVAAE